VLLFVLVSAYAAAGQVVERVFGDARQYHHAALAFTEHRYPIAAEGPFVYRIATPWLASVINPALKRITPRWLDDLVDYATGLDDVLPFYLINAAASLLFAVLFLRYLRSFIASAWLRLLLLAMWLAQWHTPARLLFFNPVNVEPLFLLAIMAGLTAIEEQRAAPAWRAAIVLVPLAFLGTLCRESMVLLPVAFVASRRPLAVAARRDWREALLIASPLVATVAALAFTRYIAAPTNAYEPLAEPLRMLRNKPVDSWVLAWFFTFGPAAIALMASAAPTLWTFLRRRPEMLVWLIGAGGLAFVGGSDTERILGWAAPVVYVLLGLAIAEQAALLSRRPVLVAGLVIVQLLSARVFWPIPVGYDDPQPLRLAFTVDAMTELADRVLVIRHNYANLWSFFGSRPLHLVNLAVDLGFAAALAWWLRRQHAPAIRAGVSG
jgi:hypothetical protein